MFEPAVSVAAALTIENNAPCVMSGAARKPRFHCARVQRVQVLFGFFCSSGMEPLRGRQLEIVNLSGEPIATLGCNTEIWFEIYSKVF